MLPLFFFLVLKISFFKKLSEETYGSAQLRVESIEDRVGRKAKKDTLVYNLYDYWTSHRNPNRRFFR